jgi:hypothetical protein
MTYFCIVDMAISSTIFRIHLTAITLRICTIISSVFTLAPVAIPCLIRSNLKTNISIHEKRHQGFDPAARSSNDELCPDQSGHP